METCVRGFSFMSDSKNDLQYIEGGELERAWRNTRRERMKQREQRIWDNFVTEQDAVKGVCNDDPYLFLDKLPESSMKELMENETTRKNSEEDVRPKELSHHGTGDNTPGDGDQHTCVVTFVEDMDKDDSEMFHIFDDEQSGAEDEILNQSMSPETVREIPAESAPPSRSPEREISLQKSSSKSSENIASVIESNIYCAKVKDLRVKINEELLALMTTLDRRDILLSTEPTDVARMIKRSAEFCNRFNRIYMYQLQRQMHDIKRNNSVSLPFAKHTQFQSQMARIVSLHQNLLQSFQVFHKSFAQTCCVRESAGALGALLAAARECTRVCLDVPPHKDCANVLDLYKDDLLTTCDKVDEFVSEYAIRCEEFLNSFETMNSAQSKKMPKNNKVKKRTWNKNTVKNDTDAKLFMYSTNTFRLNLNMKSSNTKDNKGSSPPKVRTGNDTSTNQKKGSTGKTARAASPKSQRKLRRPLMRDPHAGRPRAPRTRPTNESDIRTMVETVATCTSNHMISEDSPVQAGTPRHVLHAPHAPHAPHVTHAAGASLITAAQLLQIAQLSPRAHNTPRAHKAQELSQKKQPSPSHPKRIEIPSPSKPKPRESSQQFPIATSTLKNEEVEGLEMMPVLTIKCAKKRDLKVDEGSKVESSRVEGKKMASARREEVTEKDTRNATQDGKLVHKYGESNKTGNSPRISEILRNATAMKENSKISNISPEHCEVTRVLKQLCSGDTSGKTERVTGAKNAQLVFMNGNSPRQASTPHLLKILEETIKKVPKSLQSPVSTQGLERHRLLFNIDDKTSDTLFQYRTKFVQHMLTSSMYANSAVGKPWEMIGNVSEQIINELLLGCVKEMEIWDVIQELYKKETLA